MKHTCAKCRRKRYSTGGYCFVHYTEYRLSYEFKKRGGPSKQAPRRRHGCTYEPWFQNYEGMIARVDGRKGEQSKKWYAHVRVHASWRRDPRFFGLWALRNGFEPGLTLDRIDPEKGYTPKNCQWVTLSENVRRSHETSPRRHGKDGRFIGA